LKERNFKSNFFILESEKSIINDLDNFIDKYADHKNQMYEDCLHVVNHGKLYFISSLNKDILLNGL
jgi:hypothetical protein